MKIDTTLRTEQANSNTRVFIDIVIDGTSVSPIVLISGPTNLIEHLDPTKATLQEYADALRIR